MPSTLISRSKAPTTACPSLTLGRPLVSPISAGPDGAGCESKWCGRDTALNRLATDAYQWNEYERTSFGHKLSNRCRGAGLAVAHYGQLLRLTDNVRSDTNLAS